MVHKLDGKPGIVGFGKLHFRQNFKQHIVKVNKRLFNVLRDNYDHIRTIHENQSHVKIETYERRFSKVVNVFITCSSPIRENLIQPTEELKDLFYPFIKRLTAAQFSFLNETDQGENEMEKIEDYFGYKIYFGIMKHKHSLKIYCLEEMYESVEAMIDQIFEKHQVFVLKVSYRGKGLAKVEEVLKKLIKQNEQELKKNRNSKLTLRYNIIFRWREVQIYGD
jgi:hypothetical protein